MAKFNVVDMNGQHVSEIELSDAVFGITPNEKAVHIAVVNFLANQRQGTQNTKIRMEEQHVRSYLQIQETRYHDIMEYHILIDPELYGYQIPKMTLQPIVENALYHGIKCKRSKGQICIRGEKKQDLLILTVTDDGVGMEEADLQDLQKEIEKPCKQTDRGFGLANVNERLHMYFGAEYGVKIASRPGEGTQVTIVIPAVHNVTGEAIT